jgi:cytochrome c oxidase subunit 4
MSGHVSPLRVYYTIFAALMVLTGITVAVAFVNLGPFNFPVAISIAVFKATLVVLFFMHAKYSSRLTKLFIATGFFFLVILFTLTLTDYLSRGWPTAPPSSNTGSGGRRGPGYEEPR